MKQVITDRAARTPPFIRAAFAAAQGGVSKRPSESFLARDDHLSRAFLTRADASPGSTTGVGNAAEVVQDSFGAFIASLKPYSAAARIMAGSVPATLGSAATGMYPTRAAGPAAPQWVGENDAIPVEVANFTLVTVGPKKKIASIIPWTLELGKRSDAAAIFEVLLREDVAAGLDSAMLSTDAVSASVHAGLLNGLVALAGMAGGDAVAIETDLAALASAVATAGSGAVMFVVSPDRLARLRILHPLLAPTLDIAASAAVPADRVIAVEAASIVTAIDDIDLDFGPQATLHMSTVPLEIVSTVPTTADPVRSLWQTASTALRVIIEMAWAKRRAGAVAYLDGATW